MIKKVRENPFLAADIIVGFPGETDDDFSLTCELMEELGFSELHVFPFSPRPGTAAEKMKGRVPERIIGERTEKLRRISKRLHRKYLESWEGREMDFLLEEPLNTGTEGKETSEAPFLCWSATAENYLRIPLFLSDKFIKNSGSSLRGSIVKAVVRRDSEDRFSAYAG